MPHKPHICYRHCQHEDLCAELSHLKRRIEEQEEQIKAEKEKIRRMLEILLEKS